MTDDDGREGTCYIVINDGDRQESEEDWTSNDLPIGKRDNDQGFLFLFRSKSRPLARPVNDSPALWDAVPAPTVPTVPYCNYIVLWYST